MFRATILAATAVTFAAGGAPPPATGALKLRLVPAPEAGEPWLAVTEGTAREILQPGPDGRFEPLRLTVERVKVDGGQNVSVKVFVNTLRATAETSAKDVHHVGQASFFPMAADAPGFVMNPVPALRKLATSGLLRLDRPLVFSFVPAPESPDRPFAYKDWAITGVSLEPGQN